MTPDSNEAIQELIDALEETVSQAKRFNGIQLVAGAMIEDLYQDNDLIWRWNDNLRDIRNRMLRNGIECRDEWLTFELFPVPICCRLARRRDENQEGHLFEVTTSDESKLQIDTYERVLIELEACLVRRQAIRGLERCNGNATGDLAIENHPEYDAEKQKAVDFKKNGESWSDLESNPDIKYGRTATTNYAKATDQLPLKKANSGRPSGN